ncbi:hypothetical protein Tco_1249491 [Tanacetum coccineum]
MPSDSTTLLSPDHPLIHTSPTLVPFLRRSVRMVMCVPPAMSPGLSTSIVDVVAMSDLAFLEKDEEEEEGGEKEDKEIKESSDSDSGSEDAEDEGPTAEDEDPAAGDEGLAARDEAMGEPLRLGYGALSHREIALEEGRTPSVFEVGQSSRSVPESERSERESALRQPTLTTWTSPSPEWSSGSLPVSPAPSIVPSPISSPMRPLTVPSLIASPATAETEGFLTKSGADKDEIFSQRYRFRSLEHEQERVAVTFGAFWRLVLALELWARQTDAQRATLWHAISDTQKGESGVTHTYRRGEACAVGFG